MHRLWALLLTLFLALAAPAHAQAPARTPHMQVRLVAEHATVQPGVPFSLAFVMRPQPGWHGYWRNPGAAAPDR